MAIRSALLVGLSLSLAAACSSTGSLQDSPGGAGGGGGGGTGGGQSGSGGGGTGGAAPPTMEISGLAYGNGTFVAVGSELQNALLWTGVIYASADGAAWTRVMGLSGEPHDVKFGNGKFVAIANAVSDSGVYPPKALVSDDGRTWTTSKDLPQQLVAQRIAFGAGMFVTAGMQSHLRSTDGMTWTAFGPEPASYFSGTVDFAGGRFLSWTKWEKDVAVYDGNTWSSGAVSATNYMLDDLRVVNDRFVGVTRYDCCFGEAPDQIRWGTVSSADASTWTVDQTALTVAPPQTVYESGTICIAFRGFDLLIGDTCRFLTVAFNDNNFRPEALVYAGGVFVVSGMAGILSSSDGRVWTKRL